MMTLQSRLPPLDMVLPPADTKRWSPSRKAAVIAAARAGLISREEARARYMLSDEELAEWERAFDRDGVPGLRTTRLQSYRYARPYAARALRLDFGAGIDSAAEPEA
jgi:hypothetical protein